MVEFKAKEYYSSLTCAMKIVHRIIFSFCSLMLFTGTLEAKAWRGIAPLRSNRADVARALDQTIGSDVFRFEYERVNEDVEFLFSGTEKYDLDCVRSLQPGTILAIEITPKNVLHLVDLEPDLNRLKELEPSGEFIIQGQAYVDENEGFVITAANGIVRKIVYIASKKDQHLCATYYQEPRRFTDRIICILCPTISVASPETAEAGTPITFSANVTVGTPQVPLTYKWTVSAGTIIEGQGTNQIKVETKHLEGSTITATVELGGMDSACSNKASSDTQILARPKG